MQRKTRSCIGNYKLLNSLGHGSTCTVFYAEHGTLKQIVALKRIDKSSLQHTWEFDRSITNLTHPNIIKIHEVFETQDYLVVAMKCASPTTLAARIERGALPIDSIKRIVKQLLMALDYLSKKKTVHRDVKPENILVDNDDQVTLCDFGMAKHVTEGVMNQTACGTPIYVAPEVIKREPYECKVDIWSLGVILYRMAFGVFPFMKLNIPDLMRDIAEKPADIPKEYDPALADLLEKMLEKDPHKRISAREALSHEWFSDCHIPEATVDEGLNTEVLDRLVHEYNVDRSALIKSVSEGARDELDGMYQILVSEKKDRLLSASKPHTRGTWSVNTFTSFMGGRRRSVGSTGFATVVKPHKRVVSLIANNGKMRPALRV